MDAYLEAKLAQDKMRTLYAEAAQRRLAREAQGHQRHTRGVLVQAIALIVVGLRLAGKA
jgi:hypothetical protein